MEQESKVKPESAELNLEDIETTTELSEIDMEVARYSDPMYEEEAKRKLHEISMKIEALAEESRITLASIFQEASKEKGMMNKLAMFLRRLKDKMTATGSSTHNSISFITGTIRALDSYKAEIPVHIASFQNGISTMRAKKHEVINLVKVIKDRIKLVNSELEKIRKQLQKETDPEKKEILRAKEQDIVNKLQNVEIRGNRSLKELEGLNNTTELFLEMKGGYEVLLKQVSNLSEDLKKHKRILETIGPSVAEVRRVVLTLDKFTNLVADYRRRDNEEVRLTTRAIVEITPAIQNMERSWYNQKTIKIVKKNVKDARKVYKDHFGTDITKLEDYDKQGVPKPKPGTESDLEPEIKDEIQKEEE